MSNPCHVQYIVRSGRTTMQAQIAPIVSCQLCRVLNPAAEQLRDTPQASNPWEGCPVASHLFYHLPQGSIRFHGTFPNAARLLIPETRPRPPWKSPSPGARQQPQRVIQVLHSRVNVVEAEGTRRELCVPLGALDRLNVRRVALDGLVVSGAVDHGRRRWHRFRNRGHRLGDWRDGVRQVARLHWRGVRRGGAARGLLGRRIGARGIRGIRGNRHAADHLDLEVSGDLTILINAGRRRAVVVWAVAHVRMRDRPVGGQRLVFDWRIWERKREQAVSARVAHNFK